MLITKEQIDARVADLQKQADKLRNELNAVGGALQDCGFWLAQLEKPEPEMKKE